MKKLFLLGSMILFVGAMLFGAVSYEHGEDLGNTAPFKDGVAMLMISHTEYWSGETGEIISKLVDYQLNPIIVNYCVVDAWYPDNKTKFLDSETTTDTLQYDTGTHYKTFTTPTVEGVYEYMMTCNYNQTPALTRNVTTSNSFHLNPALNYLRDINESLYLEINENEIIITDVNNTVNNIEGTVTSIETVVTDINNTVNDIRSDQFTTEMAEGNFTYVNERLDQISTNLTAIQQFCDSAETSGSSLCAWVEDTNNKVQNLNETIEYNNEILLQLNSTSNSIYDYMTVDLTNIINGMFGNINSTLSFVEDINATVTDVKENVSAIRDTQTNVVYMNVFSG
jgi:hypothetical protein